MHTSDGQGPKEALDDVFGSAARIQPFARGDESILGGRGGLIRNVQDIAKTGGTMTSTSEGGGPRRIETTDGRGAAGTIGKAIGSRTISLAEGWPTVALVRGVGSRWLVALVGGFCGMKCRGGFGGNRSPILRSIGDEWFRGSVFDGGVLVNGACPPGISSPSRRLTQSLPQQIGRQGDEGEEDGEKGTEHGPEDIDADGKVELTGQHGDEMETPDGTEAKGQTAEGGPDGNAGDTQGHAGLAHELGGGEGA